MDITGAKMQINRENQLAVSRMAILWGSEDLLGEAIESILTAAKHWQVIKILGNHDAGALTREVEKIHPEIVIINQGDCADDFPAPIQLIESFPELKIITINSENNLIEVYDRQVIRINRTSDLLSIIGEQFSSKPEGGDTGVTEP